MAMGSKRELNLEKQMGCMAGFLQLFDRHHFLTGKRLYSTKRLPSSRVVDTALDLEISLPRELGKLKQSAPLPPPVFNLKDGSKSSWKFYRDSPRLSLDSRATVDAKGGLHPKDIRTTASDTSDGFQQQSPSVIARLMGLEPLHSETEKKPELRRSASESRASRDLFHSRFVAEGGNSFSKLPSRSNSSLIKDGAKENTQLNAEYEDPRDHSWKQGNKAALSEGSNRIGSGSPWKLASQHRKCLLDSGDIFPESKQTSSIRGEIGKRLKTGEVNEASKDLETLKQILEALQLKGLLHSSKPSCSNQTSHRVFVYDESPIVLIRPSRLPTSTSSMNNPRNGNDCSPVKGGTRDRRVLGHCSFAGENSPSANPRLERYASSPTTRNDGGASMRRPKSPVNPKPSSVGIQKRLNESIENRRVAPNQSPIRKPRRTKPEKPANCGSHRSMKTAGKTKHKEKITTSIVVDDESSSISGSSSITTSTDTERSKTAGYKEGKNLLERCDKLLNSAAEMNETVTQPSPVSVLDSSLESLTPSPVKIKRSLDFKDESVDLEEEIWSPVVLQCGETVDDSDLLYISDILRASRCLSEESDVFLLLEKQQYLKGKDTSKVSRLQRKLIFDTITEILDRNRHLPPCKTAAWDNHNVNKSLLNKVWSEFQRIREPNTAQNLFAVICGVLRKDLSAGDATACWTDCPVEKWGAVLDMERMIFKDLIGETIQDLAALAYKSSSMSCQWPRRTLAFQNLTKILFSQFVLFSFF